MEMMADQGGIVQFHGIHDLLTRDNMMICSARIGLTWMRKSMTMMVKKIWKTMI
jgi:hypothetical protein